MVDLGGILAGGAAGGFQQYGEIAESRMKERSTRSVEEARNAAAEKRAKNLARLGQLSGQFQSGKELTFGQLEDIPEEERGLLQTTEEYETGKAEKAFKAKKTEEEIDVKTKIAEEERAFGREKELINLKKTDRPTSKPTSDIEERKLWQKTYSSYLDRVGEYTDEVTEEDRKEAALFADRTTGLNLSQALKPEPEQPRKSKLDIVMGNLKKHLSTKKQPKKEGRNIIRKKIYRDNN